MSSSFLSTFKIEKRTFLGKSSARITIFFSCMVGFLDNSTFEKLFFHGTLVKFSVNIFPAILTFEKSHKDDLQQIFLKLFFRIWDIFLYSVTNFAFVIVKAVSVEKYVAFSARHGKVLFISTLSLKKKRKTFWRTFVFFFCQRCFFAFMTIITNIKKRSHWFDDIEMVLFFQKVNFVSFSFVGCENDYDKMVRINHVDFDVNKISKNLNTFFKSFP